MTSMTVGAATTTFKYNGDGTRISRTTSAGTTYYVGNHYEIYDPVSGTTTFNKYYYFDTNRIAARINGTLFYMQADHLGSSSLVMTSGGALNTRQTYYPYGAKRVFDGSALPTDYTFTGQKSDDSTGLMFYNARYYDTTIGRFTQADSIIPNVMDPQSFNRYAYTLNNPVRYTDPTGHKACDDIDGCDPTLPQDDDYPPSYPPDDTSQCEGCKYDLPDPYGEEIVVPGGKNGDEGFPDPMGDANHYEKKEYPDTRAYGPAVPPKPDDKAILLDVIAVIGGGFNAFSPEPFSKFTGMGVSAGASAFGAYRTLHDDPNNKCCFDSSGLNVTASTDGIVSVATLIIGTIPTLPPAVGLGADVVQLGYDVSRKWFGAPASYQHLDVDFP